MAILSAFACSLPAQILQPDTPYHLEPVVTTQISVFPIAGYTSDYGFFGGGFLQRINYGVDREPFLSNFKTDFTISTKGNIDANFDYERTTTFDSDVRSRITFSGSRERESNYFGIGNDAVFDEELFEDGFYFFEKREFILRYQARKNIYNDGDFKRLDLFGVLSFGYVDGISIADETGFTQERPIGFGNSWLNTVGFGLIFDTRDSEFSASSGLRYEGGFKTGSPLIGSDHSFSDVHLDLRHYLSLTDNIVLAQKIRLEHILGTAPFWALSTIGNKSGLRGYHMNRFMGDSSALHMLELRTWFLSFFDNELRIGAQGFWDTGRVYSEFDSNKLFGDWNHSVGAGVAISIFNPDFIIRADLGFSEEATRIYAGAGYIF